MTPKRFFIRFFVFSLPVLALALGLEWKLCQIPTSYALKRQLVERVAPTVEVLVFGTSHAFYDLDPAAFSRPGFNFANTSQSLMIDAQLFRKYFSQFSKLRVVVLALSYFSFEYRLYGEPDDYREFFYPREYGVVGDGGLWSLFDLRLLSQLAIFGPDVAKRMLQSNFSENHAEQVSESGWFDSARSAEKHLPVSDEAGKGRAEFHTSIMKAKYAEANLAAIESIVALARSRNIKVVLAQLPANVTYTKYLDPGGLARFDRYVSQVRARDGLEFFDYLKDPRFQPGDFYDNDHLNSAAASRFSKIFDLEVLAPLIEH